jgi:hypothetical protein
MAATEEQAESSLDEYRGERSQVASKDGLASRMLLPKRNHFGPEEAVTGELTCASLTTLLDKSLYGGVPEEGDLLDRDVGMIGERRWDGWRLTGSRNPN